MLNQNNSEEIKSSFAKKERSKDAVLYLLEQARIQQVNLDYEQSRDSYKKAFALLDKQNNRAKVSISRVGFQALSMLSNDSVVPYLVAPYEQVLAHISQAKNYIYLKDTESASVEMRIAQQLQRDIELNHEKELEKKTSAQSPAQLDQTLEGLDSITSRVKNTYQNSYAFYMAANLWEVIGEYNDALVDYKKAYELQPDPQIAEDIKRVELSSKHKITNQIPVIIFIEQGLVPQKVENKLAIPMPPNGILNIAFASYEPSSYSRPQTMNVSLNNHKIKNSYVLNDIGALAVKQLKEQTTTVVSNQILRATTKFVAQQQLGQQFGPLGQIAGNLLNITTEHADLRTWSTLPSNTQIARLSVPQGKHSLQLSSAGLNSDSLTLNAEKNQTIFVYAYHVNNKIILSSSSLSPH
ncbi:hypothetical protein LVY74_08965 [Acinetobacter sp. ME22]|uniref:COG3014 family protein n=1 Tax=Acinetobacter sp. ME22 TaxID=2904802 RepID=UPI001EDA4651|nr:hypothetical protein [Acinetobacter sp. ME22]MCG2573688.1 hypothetical protein [Acinetobacter sp. ME22]